VCAVKLTPAYKCLLIFLIPLTLTWKLVAKNPALDEMQGRIVQFLTTHKFDVSTETLVGNFPVVRATRGDCSMVVLEASPDGSTRDITRRVTTAMEQSFVVFQGNIYTELPTWLAVTQDWWTRSLRKLGIAQAEASPIMVAATCSCAAEQLPWAELSGGS
jgi:hypothetical protein